VIGAATMLDWLGPAAASIAGGRREMIRVISHARKKLPPCQRRKYIADDSEQMRYAQLVPPNPNRRATTRQTVIERVTWRIHIANSEPFGPRHRSELSKGTVAAHRRRAEERISIGIAPPQCLDRLAGFAHRHRSATHLSCKLLDFASGVTRADVFIQLAAMVARKAERTAAQPRPISCRPRSARWEARALNILAAKAINSAIDPEIDSARLLIPSGRRDRYIDSLRRRLAERNLAAP